MARRVNRARARLERGRLALFGLSLALAGAAGCDVVEGSCGEELEAEGASSYVGGTTEDGIYMSSSWDPEDLIELAPGQIVRFEHELGTVPRSVLAYVASARQGDGSALVLASGNEVEIVSVDDAAVTVQNGTCSDFFVLVVAQASAPAP